MTVSRTDKSVKNIAFSLISQMTSLVLAFVSRSIFLHCLSIDYLGVQGLFSNILTMISLADLGFGTAMAHTMYEPLAQNDRTRLAALTTFYKKVYRIIATVMTLLGLALVPFLGYLVNLQTPIPDLTQFYLLYLANSVASYFFVYKTCIVTADQKGYILTRNTMMFNIASTVFSCALLLLTRSYVAYLAVVVVFTYAGNIWNSHVAQKMYPFINEDAQLPREERAAVFKDVKAAFLYKLSGVLINGTDNILISVIVSTSMVGYFANYSTLISKSVGFINTFFNSCTPSVGNLVVNETPDRRRHVFGVMQSLSAILGAVFLAAMASLAQDFIAVWLGSAFVLDNVFLCAILLDSYLTICLLPIVVFRDAAGIYRKTKYLMMGTAVLNIGLSIGLGLLLGLPGIIYATAISKLLTYFWYEPILLFRDYLDGSAKTFFGRFALNAALAVVLAAAVWFGASFIPVDGWLTLVLKAAAVLIGAGVLTVAVYWRSEGMKIILSRLKRKK